MRVFRYRNPYGMAIAAVGDAPDAHAAIARTRQARAKLFKRERQRCQVGRLVAFSVAKRRKKRTEHELPRTVMLAAVVDSYHAGEFDLAAERRGLTRGALLGAIIEAVIESDLFNAVLDDGAP